MKPAEFSTAKQLLLERRLQSAKARAKSPSGIPRVARSPDLPLSFAQQRLWFLDQLIPGSPAYNIWEIVRLTGPLDRSALQWSLGEIVGRHESLRTVFEDTDGQPVQKILTEPEFGLEITDLRAVPEQEREGELKRLAIAESKKPFDLTRDLMMRAKLFQLTENEHVLAITMHHIASDAWSLGLLFQELAELYEARVTGRNAALPDLPIQYADYATWQREWLQGAVLEQQLGYWKKQLTGAPDFLELPTDKARPAVQSFSGGAVSISLRPELAQALRGISRSEGATPFMTLLAAFNVLLYRYTRQTDILVGSPIAGRTQIETEKLIGFFVNTLVLRNDLSGNPSFRELVRRVRQITLDAYAHQDLPLEKLVSELKPERSSSHSPLFQVMFVLQNGPTTGLKLPGLTATPIGIDNETAKFDLILSVTDTSEEFIAGLEYNEDVFRRDTVERMLGNFRVLLEAIAAQPETPISQLPILTPDEEKQLLHAWNTVRTEYPRNSTITELFEAQAAASPEAPAVSFKNTTVTYRELNERANRLAHWLRAAGVNPGSAVAVIQERSTELIVSLLAILKAGGAYVSIDPAYPMERLQLMWGEIQPRAALTQNKFYALASKLPGNIPAICVDKLQNIQQQSGENPLTECSPESIAYISFTSGSTGRPKGVCVPHRGVVRLVRNTNFISVKASDVFLQLAPVAFDASTLEVWGALLNGARLVVFPPESPSLADLGDVIEKERVTALWLTSGLFQQMVEEQLPRLKNLTCLLAGGDVLSTSHVKKAFGGLPNCRLINGYGPTENTTFSCCHQVTAASFNHRSIPIGKPIANTEVYVLDPERALVPVGVPGELYVGGDGLAKGYLGNSDLTAEKFVPNPFNPAPGSRLYKTGDLVRWLPGGELEFLGRIDNQVKIRGFRVEPGEIEAAAQSHPQVKDCVVTVRRNESAGNRLVAYFVPKPDAVITSDSLRNFLQQKLPDYMVPAFFVPLSELPLNANGKVERKSLPSPETGGAGENRLLPRDPIESQLLALWQETLDVSPIDIRSNFFQLGGHSLLAVRLVAQMEKVLGKRISVAALFQSPTIEQLARVVRGDNPNSSSNSIVEIQAKGNRPPLFLVHGVGGGMFWGYTNLAKHLGTAQPIYALKSRGMDGSEEFSTIEEMAAYYIADIRRIQPQGPYYLGGYCFGGNVAYEMAQQLHQQGHKVAFLALINCGPPNSSYGQIKWTPAFALKFVRNLGYWTRHSLEWSKDQRREFIRWKLRSLKKRVDRLWHRGGRNGHVDVDMLVDLSPYPQDQRRLWEAHIQALIKYHPKPYAGSVTLFRSPGHQLLCSLDEQYGWGELAQGGVEVKVVSGAHEQILEEPHVEGVARELGQALKEAQRASEAVSSEDTNGDDAPGAPGSDVDFWKQSLSETHQWACLSPFSEPPQSSKGTGVEHAKLPVSIAQSLRRFSQREGASLLMTLLAACGTLVYRYSRQEAFAIAALSPLRSRHHASERGQKTEALFVCPVRFNADWCFQQALSAIGKSLSEAMAHGPVPAELLFSHLRDMQAPAEEKNAIPLVVGMAESIEAAGVAWPAELALLIHGAGDQLTLSCFYESALFSSAWVERFLGHLQQLLKAALEEPNRRVQELSLLTRSEEELLVDQWNRTQRNYPLEISYAQLFSNQSKRHPKAMAVRCGSNQISYEALNRRANQLAHYLQKLGVGPERIVAVQTERSIEFAVALLAILKAGGAYLPLDGAYPTERLAWMLEDARVHLTLAFDKWAGILPSGIKTVSLEEAEVRSEIARLNGEAGPNCSLSPYNLAYVIYTSGSTGKPKGVEITQKSLLNHNLAIIDAFSLSARDRVLQFTPLSFDISIEEILPTWLTGGTVVFRSPDVLGSVSKFVEFLKDEEITVANLPTAYFRALTEAPWEALPSTLRLLVIGGEAVPVEHWNRMLERTRGAIELINAYGLTETTVTSTLFSEAIPETAKLVPIGRPIANTTAYILDENLRPLPCGIPGELFIGGYGVARGYRHKSESTADRFVPDPFQDNGQLYRTGDLARFRTDGNIEFLGRLDDQVKLRGFRIQLGEIESALARHPAIRQAIVRSIAYGDAEPRLVAYITGASGPNTGELIQYLQTTLPEYMIPSAFVRLETFPMTATGKIDYKALPLPGTNRPLLTQSFIAPRSELEEQITTVWREVLHIDEIGVHDNIFDLGAHSLHAMQVMGRLRDLLQLEIPVSNLFEAPTVAQLAVAIKEGGTNVRSAISGPVPRTERNHNPPLSFAQQRIWFLEQLQPGTPLYNLAQAVRLVGQLKVSLLEKTFTEIIRRHEVLRTTYRIENEEPVQVVASPRPLSIGITDLTTSPKGERDLKVRETICEEARKPFALDRDLMLRVALIKVSNEEHVLLITMHHIAADGWSIEVLWKEIAALYSSYLEGTPSVLGDLPVQYADFALWKRDWLKGDILNAQLDFWRTQLAGAPALLELPLDYARPANQSYVGARHSLAIPAEVTAGLRTLGQSEGCTLFMTLLAGFDCLLSRYSHSEDVVVGTVIANRNRPELEKLVGFFANTLVLRTDLSGAPTFRELLQRTRKTTVDAYAHQDLPFERLVEELQPARDRSYHPIFQVMLVLQNVPIPSERLPGLEVTPSDTDVGIAKFDLLLNLVESGDGLVGYIEYSTELFERGTIERMVGHFQVLLQDAVRQPDQRISRLKVLSSVEERQLLSEWNQQQLPVPKVAGIHTLFEDTAKRTPHETALLWKDQQVSYMQLNERANQLANHLVSIGIKPQDLVGICSDRNVDMVVAMWAALKAGAAYVPLDPAYPKDRLESILQDANVAAICTQAEHISLLGQSSGRIIQMDADAEVIGRHPTANPPVNSSPSSLAYVIFTSGSTGRPKGVAIEHRSVLALAAWTRSTFSMEDLNGVLAGTSICFDLSVFEILVPLAWGGKIVLADNVLQVANLPARSEVRLINTVPSAMKELLRAGGVPTSVRTINLAGEPLPQSLVDSLYQLPHVERVFDLYGPTEATVYSTFALRERGGRNHIGRPLPNEQLYIVDRNLEPVPIGVAGELLIGGSGLARGYLNQPELTQERFIPNPFAKSASTRLYKTGDLVRYLPDGKVEYLGRIDHQVKIRGFRIELGEIETQLRKHPSVREAVVLADDDPSGNKRLVVYTVPPAPAGPDSAELREHLKRALPEYMVPALFLQLESLPLTPNGKVDRKALPKPELQRAAAESFDEPRSDAELLLSQIWSEVLDIPRVGIRNNFFDLGGHSLMITRILSRLRDALQIDLPMKSVFEAPTIAEFAVLVENALADQINRLTDDEVLKLDEIATTVTANTEKLEV